MEVMKKNLTKTTEVFHKGFENEYSVEMVENPDTNSHIKAVGYYDDALFVKFKTGVYKYTDVPKKVYDALVDADSWGSYINREVKPVYDYDYLK